MNISQNSKKGGTCGSAGGRIPEEERASVSKFYFFLSRETERFRGMVGGGAAEDADALPSTIRPPADPTGPPLYCFEISIVG